MVYLFSTLAFLALVGVFRNSQRKNGHGMAYSGMMLSVWIAAALWWAGKI